MESINPRHICVMDQKKYLRQLKQKLMRKRRKLERCQSVVKARAHVRQRVKELRDQNETHKSSSDEQTEQNIQKKYVPTVSFQITDKEIRNRQSPSQHLPTTPDSHESIPAPDGLHSSSAPDGLHSSPAPDGLHTSPAPGGLHTSPAPGCLHSSPAPDGLESSPVTSGLDLSPAYDDDASLANIYEPCCEQISLQSDEQSQYSEQIIPPTQPTLRPRRNSAKRVKTNNSNRITLADLCPLTMNSVCSEFTLPRSFDELLQQKLESTKTSVTVNRAEKYKDSVLTSNIEYDADDSDCIPDTCGTASSTCSATSFGRSSVLSLSDCISSQDDVSTNLRRRSRRRKRSRRKNSDTNAMNPNNSLIHKNPQHTANVTFNSSFKSPKTVIKETQIPELHNVTTMLFSEGMDGSQSDSMDHGCQGVTRADDAQSVTTVDSVQLETTDVHEKIILESTTSTTDGITDGTADCLPSMVEVSLLDHERTSNTGPQSNAEIAGSHSDELLGLSEDINDLLPAHFKLVADLPTATNEPPSTAVCLRQHRADNNHNVYQLTCTSREHTSLYISDMGDYEKWTLCYKWNRLKKTNLNITSEHLSYVPRQEFSTTFLLITTYSQHTSVTLYYYNNSCDVAAVDVVEWQGAIPLYTTLDTNSPHLVTYSESKLTTYSFCTSRPAKNSNKHWCQSQAFDTPSQCTMPKSLAAVRGLGAAVLACTQNRFYIWNSKVGKCVRTIEVARVGILRITDAVLDNGLIFACVMLGNDEANIIAINPTCEKYSVVTELQIPKTIQSKQSLSIFLHKMLAVAHTSADSALLVWSLKSGCLLSTISVSFNCMDLILIHNEHTLTASTNQNAQPTSSTNHNSQTLIASANNNGMKIFLLREIK